MQVLSPAFTNGSEIPVKYTCEGENINPPLQFRDVPQHSKSLALIVEDPDAPAVKPWVHWVMFNISPSTTDLAENSVLQSAVVGKNTSGNRKYEGPCPPQGVHRYYFKLYALDMLLDLTDSTERKDVLSAMQGHIIAESEIMGTYKRKTIS